MFNDAFRYCTVFVYIELEPLDWFVVLLRIDNLVKRTASEGGNHLDDIVLLRTTCKYYFTFGISEFTYSHIRFLHSLIEVQGKRS